jgi:hypothetical protein
MPPILRRPFADNRLFIAASRLKWPSLRPTPIIGTRMVVGCVDNSEDAKPRCPRPGEVAFGCVVLLRVISRARD